MTNIADLVASETSYILVAHWKEAKVYQEYLYSTAESETAQKIDSSSNFTSGAAISDGALYSMSAAADLKAIADAKANTFVMPDGSSVASNNTYGLSTTGEIGKRSGTDLITITAKADIKVTLYVMGAKYADFGTVRQFTIYNGANSAEDKVALGTTSTDKRGIVAVTLNISSGNTVTISAATTNGSDGNGVFIYGVIEETV